MADKHRLHISKLEDFKAWLIKDGWSIEKPKGTWEVLRARNSGRKNPLIVYTRMDAKEHLSVMDRDSGVIGAFLRDSKKPNTNADRILAMSDEELAEFLRGIENGHDIFCGDYLSTLEGVLISSNDNINQAILEWLQSEVD